MSVCACVAERPRVERAFDQTRLGAHVLVKASLASLSPDPCFDTAYCQDRALRRCLAPVADACRHDCRCVCALLHVTLWSAGAQNVGRRQLQCVHERISMMCVHKHTADCTNGTRNITKDTDTDADADADADTPARASCRRIVSCRPGPWKCGEK